MNYKDKIQHPWQSGPTELIAHAIEHYHKGTESDNRIAYLLFDVGVETLFKTFLTLPDKVVLSQIKRNERIQAAEGNFHELLQAIQKSNPKKASEFNYDHLEYFHDLRNTLYHQGNRVTTVPTDQLKEYALVAVKLLKEYLDVEIDESNKDESNKQELLRTDYFPNFSRIRMNIVSLESNSSLIVEHLYPQIATRKIEAQLRFIRTDTGPDDLSYPPDVRAEFAQQRIEAFNKITGWDFTEDEHEFMENLIDNPELLHIWLAFEEIGNGDWRNDWKKYRSVVKFLEGEHSKTDEKRYEEIDKWICERAKSVYNWLIQNVPEITPRDYRSNSLFD